MKHLKKIKKLKSKTDKSSVIKYIEDNLDEVLKEKASIYKTHVNSTTNLIASINKQVITDKVLKVFDINSIELKDGEILNFSVMNTYLFMDNHDDVHAINLFKDNLDNLFHQSDHEFKVKSRVGDVKKAIELDVEWRDLGFDKDGETQCLVFVSVIKEDYNKTLYKDYLNNKANQHSVGMWYIDLKLAVNNPLNKERYALWKEYIDLIGNKQDVIDNGYFYVIYKAGLREASYVMLGSNSLTPSLKSYTKEDLDKNKNKNKDNNISSGVELFLKSVK